jgi:hypothetical protein
MPIREFELFHGAVLTKLVRADRPITLRMIETRPADAWSTYRINDAVSILLKHSTRLRPLRRKRGAAAWSFVFSTDQIEQLSKQGTWAALVCCSSKIGRNKMETCLLDPDQLNRLLDLTAKTQQSITVKRLPGKRLRVVSPRTRDLVVARNRIETWRVPGS